MYTPWENDKELFWELPQTLQKAKHVVGVVYKSATAAIMQYHNKQQLRRWALLFALHFRNIPAYVVLEIAKVSGFYNHLVIDKHFVEYVQGCRNSATEIMRKRAENTPNRKPLC